MRVSTGGAEVSTGVRVYQPEEWKYRLERECINRSSRNIDRSC
ncbi:hypothetical protein ACFQ1Y_03140 [Virgibacillus alimentarius]